MREANRTGNCKKCGEVLFKIKSSTGYVFFYCANCNAEVAKIRCNKYETLLSTCEECGGDIFKVRIKVDEQGISCWQPECVECKGSPRSVYKDNEGKIINEDERAQLILKEKLKELEEDINNKQETIEELEDEVDTKQETIEELESQVYDLKNELEGKDNRIYDLEDELDKSKERISELENHISDLEWEISRLE